MVHYIGTVEPDYPNDVLSLMKNLQQNQYNGANKEALEFRKNRVVVYKHKS